MKKDVGHERRRREVVLRGKGKTFVNVFPFPLKLPLPLSKLFNRKGRSSQGTSTFSWRS